VCISPVADGKYFVYFEVESRFDTAAAVDN
jgi:hypothetical protein